MSPPLPGYHAPKRHRARGPAGLYPPGFAEDDRLSVANPHSKEHPLSRPPLGRAAFLAGLLLSLSGAVALAKPPFETGAYLGTVAARGKPQVEFTATRKRVKQLDIGSQPVTCSNGQTGTINLPGTPATRSLKLTHGKFQLKVKASGSDPEHAGTSVSGKLKGQRATGTLRVVFRIASSGDPNAVVCDTGTRKWKARLEDVIVELP